MNQPITVPQGYQCPFCVNHVDEVFYASVLIEQPICEGCDTELFVFQHHQKRPANHLIKEVERRTGLTWEECRALLLRNTLETWRTIKRTLPLAYVQSTILLGLTEDDALQEAQHQVQHYTQLLEQVEAVLLSKKDG